MMISPDVQDLLDWFEEQGLSGWDPYDIQDSYLFRLIEAKLPRLPRKIIIRLLSEIAYHFPYSSRRLLGVKEQVNNKSLGLLLISYAKLYRITKNNVYLFKAENIVETLLNGTSVGFEGKSWGYPFVWKSPIELPINTPSTVVSSIVGAGFFALYEATGTDRYLSICSDICHFFEKSLNTTFRGSHEGKPAVCRSYTPLDDYQVHNANLFAAEFLIRIGSETECEEWVSLGKDMTRFAIMEQDEEGFIPYWGRAQTDKYSGGRIHLDHYHSGFEIRCLLSISAHTKNAQFEAATQRYITWYLKHMYNANGDMLYAPGKQFPINIHSCAEAVLVRLKLYDLGLINEDAKPLIEFINKHMKITKGQYAHLVKSVIGIKMKSPIALHRWGQAWMLLALVTDLEHMQKKHTSKPKATQY